MKIIQRVGLSVLLMGIWTATVCEDLRAQYIGTEHVGQRIENGSVPLFACLEAAGRFSSAPLLDKERHNQRRLDRQQSDKSDDAVSIALPKSRLLEQDLGACRQPVLVKVPAPKLTPVKCNAVCIRPGDWNSLCLYATQNA